MLHVCEEMKTTEICESFPWWPDKEGLAHRAWMFVQTHVDERTADVIKYIIHCPKCGAELK